MSNVPFLESASVQFEPFVMSVGAEMSPRSPMQTLTEGVRDKHERYRHMTFRITQVFPSYLERRQSLRRDGSHEAHAAAHLHDKDDFLKRKWKVSCREAEVHAPQEMFFFYPQTVWLPRDKFKTSEDLLCFLYLL